MPDLPEAIAIVETGDAAWDGGQRRDAVAAWRRAGALAQGDAPGDLAARAMVHLRLVHVEGNLAPFWHEGAWTRALRDCPRSDSLCALAHADRELLVPTFAGADPTRVAPALERLRHDGELAAAAEARLSRAEAGWSLATAPTWSTALALSYAPLAGTGVGLRFVHPDLGFRGHRVEASASADASGNFGIDLRGQLRGRPSGWGQLGLGHGPVYRWEGDDPVAYTFTTGTAALGLGLGPLSAGLAARADAASLGDVPTVSPVAGPRATVSTSPAGARIGAAIELQGGAYTHLGLGLDLRGDGPFGRGSLALRVGASASPLDADPWWRWPTAGGTDTLRGLPQGRARAPLLGLAQLEYRHPVWGPLSLATFVDSATAKDVFWTVGGGARLAVPPGRENVIRVDVAYTSDNTVGAVVGFGEAF